MLPLRWEYRKPETWVFLAFPGTVPVTQSSGSWLSPQWSFQKISTEVRCDNATWWESATPHFRQTECSLWVTSLGDYSGVFRDNILELFALTHRCSHSGTHFFFQSHSSFQTVYYWTICSQIVCSQEGGENVPSLSSVLEHVIFGYGDLLFLQKDGAITPTEQAALTDQICPRVSTCWAYTSSDICKWACFLPSSQCAAHLQLLACSSSSGINTSTHFQSLRLSVSHMAVVILAANSWQALGFCLFAGLSFLMETLACSRTVSIAIPKSSLPSRSMLLFLRLCGLIQRRVCQFEMDQCFSPKER